MCVCVCVCVCFSVKFVFIYVSGRVSAKLFTGESCVPGDCFGESVQVHI